MEVGITPVWGNGSPSVDDVYDSRARLGLLSGDCPSVGDGEAKERFQFRFDTR